MDTVEKVKKDGLCISCGICKAVCPKSCINYQRAEGMYVPVITEKDCIKCGRCLRLCPGAGDSFSGLHKSIGNKVPENLYTGSFLKVCTAYAQDKTLLKNAASGAVVSVLIKSLLEDNLYQSAFAVNTFNYREMTETSRFTEMGSNEQTAGSRYIPVMQTEAVQYMLAHTEEKIIFVGTGCFMMGLWKVIKDFGLNRENYFLIGLFCDKTMNYNSFEYFEKVWPGRGKGRLDRLYFRTKQCGGWPGNACLVYGNGDAKELPAKERMRIKEYFQPERCLYCVDKLNQFSDISVGDNYTKENNNAANGGSSSVIIRTKRGQQVWERYETGFSVSGSDMEKVTASQRIDKKEKNLLYAKIKAAEENTAFCMSFESDKEPDRETRMSCQLALDNISLGKGGQVRAIKKDIGKRKRTGLYHTLKNKWKRIWAGQ